MIRLNLKDTVLRDDGLRFDPVSGTLLAPVARLLLDPSQPRTHISAAESKELRADIDDWRKAGHGLCGTGIMEALKVRWSPGSVNDDGSVQKNAKLLIWDGGRRFRVTCEDYPWLPITLEDISERQARDAALRTSLQKKLLTPIEEAHVFSEWIKENPGPNAQHRCGQYYKVGESYVRNRINLLDVPKPAQKLVNDNPDTMSHVLLMHDWAARITVHDANELRQKVRDGMSYQALREELEIRAGIYKQTKESHRAPDKETQSRVSTFQRTGQASTSRGKEVKGASARESRQEAQLALERAAINLEQARGWMNNLDEADQQRLSNKFAFPIRRRLKEIFPEIP